MVKCDRNASDSESLPVCYLFTDNVVNVQGTEVRFESGSELNWILDTKRSESLKAAQYEIT